MTQDDSANGTRQPTLADVAREAGCSPTTVSRVLNERGYLSQSLKDRVAAAIEKLGYRPNQVARALHGGATQTVGLIVPSVALPFFGEVAVHIEDALANHGYRILVCNSMGRADREREYLDLLVGHRVDGIISGAHNEEMLEYHRIHMPLVTVDREIAPWIPNVRCDNELGGQLATQHLLDRGAQAPALLTSRSGPLNLREKGYRKVLQEHGIRPVVLTVDFHTPPGERQDLVNSRMDAVASHVDAVFCTDDLAAAEVIEWARLRNVDVPRHIKVVGFDGTTTLRRALPTLTTVRQPVERIAFEAVETLVHMIRTGNGIPADHSAQTRRVAPIEFAPDLIVGATT
ncbi:LacI family DNA-binding transcriptional regulator [Schaalia suimastitidis]|uniref:LacI family DNA-binding transcriptional regulator n=1 Tax=Schaalia suimastitidis TaxID=121163 RepID=UPI0003FA7F68|nr:LacI family DNA-binding transcriptional regulator [Schaalia suimastitidis]